MSFTLTRYKDGKVIPVKVSILDAFRSAPPRKPRSVQPNKKPETKSSPVKKDNSQKTTTNSDKNANKDNNNTAKRRSSHDEESYTAKDNATIIAMKAIPGTSWADILNAIGKQSLCQLKEHYKLHLGPKAEEEQKKQAERLARAAEKKQVDGAGKEGAGGAPEKKKDDGGGNGGKKNKDKDKEKEKEKEKAKAQEESKDGHNKDTPGADALTRQNLKTFVAKYERDKWLAAASRHYDLTGQRISAGAAKKMAGGGK